MKLVAKVSLPPGRLAAEDLRATLSTLFGEGRLFEPHYAGIEEPIDRTVDADGFVDDLVDLTFHEDESRGDLWVRGEEDEWFGVLSDWGDETFSGRVYWELPRERIGPEDRAFDVETVRAVVDHVDSPLALAAADAAIQAYRHRWVPSDIGERRELTVGDYTQGIEHPHWRLWFGPEWTAFLGRDQLSTAPCVERRAFDDGYYVQVLGDPADWDTPEGEAAATRFADHFDRDAFHRVDDPDRPLEAPDFDHRLDGG